MNEPRLAYREAGFLFIKGLALAGYGYLYLRF